MFAGSPQGFAQQLESMTLTGSEAGHGGPVARTRQPAAGTPVDHRVIPLHPHPFGPSPAVKDPVLQQGSTTQVTPLVLGFNGIGVSSGYGVLYIPPDTSGAAGDTQYVQFVNAAYAVIDKQTGNFCQNVSGQAVCNQPNTSGVFFQLSGLFKAAGQTNPCATRDDGDVVVLFDRLAHRWVLSQFAVPNSGPYYHCVAVSQTNDATGLYNVYAFPQPSFPDYPKMGVWPDGYYATFNMFKGGRFLGARVCVYDRAAMLAGAPGRQLCGGPNSSYGSVLPSDLDGKAADLNASYVSSATPGDTTCSAPADAACPPVGTPNIIANFSGGFLQLGFVTVDWSAAKGTISWPQRVAGAASFTAACNGGACIPQPGTNQKLDSLGDRLMFRAAFSRPCISLSSGQCLTWDPKYHVLISHSVTVNPGSSNVTGIRWYDVSPSFSNINVGVSATMSTAINQQSTFSPDADYRWMSSIAMDRVGNVAVGYSRSSASRFPSVAVALGLAGQTNTLSQEMIVRAGSGSQTSYTRWGDYAHMSVDPVDGCTLWFTSQYQTVTGVFDWSTVIYPAKISTSCQ